MGDGVYVIENDPNITTIDDFLKLIAEGDLRRTDLDPASCVVGRGLLHVDNQHIENVCSTLLKNDNRQIQQSQLSLKEDFYGTDIMKIEREKSPSQLSQPPKKRAHRMRKSRSLDINNTITSRMHLHQQLLQYVLNWSNIDERSWDEDLISHDRAIYYNGLVLNGVKSYLEDPAKKYKSNIHPQHNRDVAKMPGINSSMYYMGCAGSYSEMYVEDANLESLNAIHFNLNPALSDAVSKIWIIVPEKEAMYAAARKNYKDTDSTATNLNLCCHFLDHKQSFVTLKFLERYNIRHTIVKQKPGDVIYVERGVFHEVINVNTNFAEAINYASSKWNCGNNMSSTCKCDGMSAIQHIRPNIQILHKIKTRKILLHVCTVEECGFNTPRWSEWGSHLQKVHNIAKPFICKKCDKKYSSSNHLAAHNCTENGQTRKVFCQFCKVKVAKLPRHNLTEIHRKNIANNSNNTNSMSENSADPDTMTTCIKCDRSMRTSRYNKHATACKGLSCPQCKKKFYAKTTLIHHQKTSHR